MGKYVIFFIEKKYLLIITLIIFVFKEAGGQTSWENMWSAWHSEKIQPINLFISQDTTDAAIAYNLLTTKAQRDSYIQNKLYEDWTSTIPSRGYIDENGEWAGAPYWMCGQWQLQLLVNSHDWGHETIYNGEAPLLLYGGYDGFDLDSIYAHGGTLKDIGMLGLPMCGVEFVVSEYAHAITGILTGDDITKWESWNFIEPRSDRINEQPGEENLKFNTDQFHIYHLFIYENEKKERILYGISIAKFKIIDGIPTFIGINPKAKIITKRESDPPIIILKSSSDPDSLIWDITEENFKSAWYTIDGDHKKSLPQNGKIKMGLNYGNHRIVVGADDYFRLTSQTTTQRNLVNAAPVINVTSPVNGKTYDTKNIPHTLKIPLKVSVVEKEFKSGYYSFDGGKTKVTMNQTEDRNLTLPDGRDYFPDGEYTMTFYAQDNYSLEATKTVKFSVGNVTGIDNISPDSRVTSYPNPTSGLTTITYPAGAKAVVKLFDSSGSLLMLVTDEDQDRETIVDVSDFPSGILFYQVLISRVNNSATSTFSGKIIVERK